jgi:hypothetical protein
LSAGNRYAFLGLAFKLMKEEEKTWRRIRGADKIGALLAGVPFKDGIDRPVCCRNASAPSIMSNLQINLSRVDKARK